MAIRTAQSEWTGDFRTGQGTIIPGSGAFTAEYTFASICGSGSGTNPIEVLGASLSGCFSGALAAYLSKAGYIPQKICTDARVQVDVSAEGFVITGIHLHTRAEVPGINEAEFNTYVDVAKQNCPVAQALSAVDITLHAELVKSEQ